MTTHASQEIEAREKAPVLTEDTRPGLVFRPDVDILEHEDAYVILADMPGTREDQVDVRLDQGVLTLDAHSAEAPDEERLRHAEFRSGGYHREFRISEDIDAERVSARMRNGVLELRLPKTAETQPRRITVEAA